MRYIGMKTEEVLQFVTTVELCKTGNRREGKSFLCLSSNLPSSRSRSVRFKSRWAHQTTSESPPNMG